MCFPPLHPLLKSWTTMALIATPPLHGTWLHWNSFALRQLQYCRKNSGREIFPSKETSLYCPAASTSLNISTEPRSHPCMANSLLHSTLQQLIYLSVTPSTRLTYNSGVTSHDNFCLAYHINPYPASTLTLQFFCTHLASRVSYKTIKVYLAGIRLIHLERRHSDPTNNEPLHILIRGICHLQGNSPRHHLPFTIKVLHIMKHQLCTGNFPLKEQRLLWAAFTLAFYSFLRVSEFTGTSLK